MEVEMKVEKKEEERKPYEAVKITTGAAMQLYQVLNKAKIACLDNDGIIRMVKNIRTLKKVSDEFMTLKQQVEEKLKPEGFGDAIKVIREDNAGKAGKAGGAPHTDEDVAGARKVLDDYNSKIMAALQPDYEKEHEVMIRAITDEQFSKLVSANEWNGNDCIGISDLLCPELNKE